MNSAHDTAQQALSLEGLAKAYGRLQALDGVTLQVSRGELFGLIGPDGAGKSTLLRIAAGVLTHDEGRVTVLEQRIHSERSADRIKDRIGYMPQGLGQNLYPELSVEENIDFLGRLRLLGADALAESKERLLEMTRLEPFRQRAMKHLSGGMKQKLGLVCTLLHEPELLLLDEPTTGVDPVSRRDFWAILADLRRQRGITVLVSTAYLDEASRFQRLALMHKGAVIARGAPQEIMQAEDDAGAAGLEDAFIARIREAEGASEEIQEQGEPGTPDREAEPAIEADGLVKRFGEFTAVDGVSFNVAPGEIYGLLGANGAGKTTAIKMLVGLQPATQGEGRILGRNARQEPMFVKERMGYMSQIFSLYDDLTVQENLRLYAGIYGLAELGRAQRKKRMDAVSRDAGIQELGRKLAGDLPVGLRQRLALACALLHQPRVLFLDEPTSGVDPVGRRAFWRLLFRLSREQGVALLVTTHYMSEAENCHRVGLMHAGKLIQDAPPETLKQDVAEEHGALLELQTDAPLAALEVLREAGHDQPSLHGDRVRLFHKQGLDAEDALRSLLDERDITLEGLQERDISMEEVFVVRMREQEAAQ